MKINKALDDVIDSIKDSDIYKEYNHILIQVDKSKDINNLVKNIKSLQKKIVLDEHKQKDVSKLLEELENIKKELYNIPLYQEYIDAAEELNDLIKLVSNKLQSYLSDLDI